MAIEYACCFCGKGIEPVGPDVGGLTYTTNIDKTQEKPIDQFFPCHTECLRVRLHPSAKLYALDPWATRNSSDESE